MYAIYQKTISFIGIISVLIFFSGTNVQALETSSLYGNFHVIDRGNQFTQIYGIPYNTVSASIDAGNSTIYFDGAGNCSMTGGGITYSADLTHQGPVNTSNYPNNDTCTYVLSSDGYGQITMASDISNPKSFSVGTDSNGNVNSFIATEAYAPPGAGQYGADGDYRASQVVGIKVNPDASAALLKGTYHVVTQDASFWQSIYGGGPSPNIYGSTGTITFDGIDKCTISLSGKSFYISYPPVDPRPDNAYVVSQPDSFTANCTYVVNQDGSARMTTSTGFHDFWVNADGAVAISAKAGTYDGDSSGTGYENSRMFSVQSGVEMNASSLQGRYRFGSLDTTFWKDNQYGGISLGISGTSGTISFNGAGMCELQENDNYYSIPATNPPGIVYANQPSFRVESCSYTVSATGGVQFKIGSKSHPFWLSADGSLLIGGSPEVSPQSNGTDYNVNQIVAMRMSRYLGTVMAPFLDVPSVDYDGNYKVTWFMSGGYSVLPEGAVFTLEESTDPGFPESAATRIAYSGSATVVNITGRTNGQVYYYQIKAEIPGYEPSGWSLAYNPCSVAAAPPASFKVPATASGDYLLTWTPSTTPDVTYVVEEDTDAAFINAREVYNGTGNQVTVFGNPVGSYYYRITVLKQGVPPSLPKSGSNICNVSARVVPTLSLALSANSIILGHPVTASGVITASNEALAGRTINLDITRPDTNIVTLSAVSDANGAFSFTGASLADVLVDPGLYLIQARAGSLKPALSPVVTVRVLPLAGYAIIVQGRAADDEGQAAYAKTVARARNALIARGFNDTDIMTVTSSSGDSGKSALQNAITVWAKDKLDTTPAPLQLILIDHGDPALFHLAPDTLTPGELSGMLDTLEASIGDDARAQARTIVIGSCYSGSFIPALAKTGRIIITSASPLEQSFRGPAEPDGIRSGEYFLDELYRNLKRGASLREAFNSSASLIRTYTRRGDIVSSSGDASLQNPLFSYAGDTVGVNEVPTGMVDDAPDSVYLGAGDNFDYNPTGMLPQDRHAAVRAVFLDASTASAMITAPAISSTMEAWFEVRAPSVPLVQDYSSGQLTSNLPKVVMSYAGGVFQGNYAGFTENGSYDVVIYQKEPVANGEITSSHITVYRNRPLNTTPQPPVLKNPVNGKYVSTALVVDWTESADPDGDIVTYTLLVSRRADMTDPALVKEGLKDPMDVVLHTDGFLDLTTYYWQVWAVDSYGAVAKSAIQTFTTNNTNGLLAYIKGYVTNTFNAPVAGAVVKAADGLTFTTLSNGGYLMPVPPKNYAMETSAVNYLPNTVAVSAASGEVTVRNITLTPSAAAFAITTAISGGNGYVTCPANVVAGDQMACTIQAGAGFQFASITGCGGSFVGNSYSATPSGDCTITAAFVAAGSAPYRVTPIHNAGGDIVCIPATVPNGGSSVCNISTNNGYRVNLLSDNSDDVTGSIVNNSYTATDVRLNRTVSVEFIRFNVTTKPLTKPLVFNRPTFVLTAAIPLGMTPEQLASAVLNLPVWAIVQTTKVAKTVGTITLALTANPTYVERERTIAVGDGTFRLWQDGISCPLPVVTVIPVGIVASKGGVDIATASVTIPEGCVWNVTVPTTATWLSVEPGMGTGSGSFTFTAASNEAAAVRKASVVVAGKKLKKTVSITQNTHIGDYAGTYSGTYDGTSNGSPVSGVFTLVFSSSGVGKLTLGALNGKDYSVTLGKVDASGNILNSKLENIGYIDLTTGTIKDAAFVNSTINVNLLNGIRQSIP